MYLRCICDGVPSTAAKLWVLDIFLTDIVLLSTLYVIMKKQGEITLDISSLPLSEDLLDYALLVFKNWIDI